MPRASLLVVLPVLVVWVLGAPPFQGVTPDQLPPAAPNTAPSVCTSTAAFNPYYLNVWLQFQCTTLSGETIFLVGGGSTNYPVNIRFQPVSAIPPAVYTLVIRGAFLPAGLTIGFAENNLEVNKATPIQVFIFDTYIGFSAGSTNPSTAVLQFYTLPQGSLVRLVNVTLDSSNNYNNGALLKPFRSDSDWSAAVATISTGPTLPRSMPCIAVQPTQSNCLDWSHVEIINSAAFCTSAFLQMNALVANRTSTRLINTTVNAFIVASPSASQLRIFWITGDSLQGTFDATEIELTDGTSVAGYSPNHFTALLGVDANMTTDVPDRHLLVNVSRSALVLAALNVHVVRLNETAVMGNLSIHVNDNSNLTLGLTGKGSAASVGSTAGVALLWGRDLDTTIAVTDSMVFSVNAVDRPCLVTATFTNDDEWLRPTFQFEGSSAVLTAPYYDSARSGEKIATATSGLVSIYSTVDGATNSVVGASFAVLNSAILISSGRADVALVSGNHFSSSNITVNSNNVSLTQRSSYLRSFLVFTYGTDATNVTFTSWNNIQVSGLGASFFGFTVTESDADSRVTFEGVALDATAKKTRALAKLGGGPTVASVRIAGCAISFGDAHALNQAAVVLVSNVSGGSTIEVVDNSNITISGASTLTAVVAVTITNATISPVTLPNITVARNAYINLWTSPADNANVQHLGLITVSSVNPISAPNLTVSDNTGATVALFSNTYIGFSTCSPCGAIAVDASLTAGSWVGTMRNSIKFTIPPLLDLTGAMVQLGGSYVPSCTGVTVVVEDNTATLTRAAQVIPDGPTSQSASFIAVASQSVKESQIYASRNAFSVYGPLSGQQPVQGLADGATVSVVTFAKAVVSETGVTFVGNHMTIMASTTLVATSTAFVVATSSTYLQRSSISFSGDSLSIIGSATVVLGTFINRTLATWDTGMTVAMSRCSISVTGVSNQALISLLNLMGSEVALTQTTISLSYNTLGLNSASCLGAGVLLPGLTGGSSLTVSYDTYTIFADYSTTCQMTQPFAIGIYGVGILGVVDSQSTVVVNGVSFWGGYRAFSLPPFLGQSSVYGIRVLGGTSAGGSVGIRNTSTKVMGFHASDAACLDAAYDDGSGVAKALALTVSGLSCTLNASIAPSMWPSAVRVGPLTSADTQVRISSSFITLAPGTDNARSNFAVRLSNLTAGASVMLNNTAISVNAAGTPPSECAAMFVTGADSATVTWLNVTASVSSCNRTDALRTLSSNSTVWELLLAASELHAWSWDSAFFHAAGPVLTSSVRVTAASALLLTSQSTASVAAIILVDGYSSNNTVDRSSFTLRGPSTGSGLVAVNTYTRGRLVQLPSVRLSNVSLVSLDRVIVTSQFNAAGINIDGDAVDTSITAQNIGLVYTNSTNSASDQGYSTTDGLVVCSQRVNRTTVFIDRIGLLSINSLSPRSSVAIINAQAVIQNNVNFTVSNSVGNVVSVASAAVAVGVNNGVSDPTLTDGAVHVEIRNASLFVSGVQRSDGPGALGVLVNVTRNGHIAVTGGSLTVLSNSTSLGGGVVVVSPSSVSNMTISLSDLDSLLVSCDRGVAMGVVLWAGSDTNACVDCQVTVADVKKAALDGPSGAAIVYAVTPMNSSSVTIQRLGAVNVTSRTNAPIGTQQSSNGIAVSCLVQAQLFGGTHAPSALTVDHLLNVNISSDGLATLVEQTGAREGTSLTVSVTDVTARLHAPWIAAVTHQSTKGTRIEVGRVSIEANVEGSSIDGALMASLVAFIGDKTTLVAGNVSIADSRITHDFPPLDLPGTSQVTPLYFGSVVFGANALCTGCDVSVKRSSIYVHRELNFRGPRSQTVVVGHVLGVHGDSFAVDLDRADATANISSFMERGVVAPVNLSVTVAAVSGFASPSNAAVSRSVTVSDSRFTADGVTDLVPMSSNGVTLASAVVVQTGSFVDALIVANRTTTTTHFVSQPSMTVISVLNDPWPNLRAVSSLWYTTDRNVSWSTTGTAFLLKCTKTEKFTDSKRQLGLLPSTFTDTGAIATFDDKACPVSRTFTPNRTKTASLTAATPSDRDTSSRSATGSPSNTLSLSQSVDPGTASGSVTPSWTTSETKSAVATATHASTATATLPVVKEYIRAPAAVQTIATINTVATAASSALSAATATQAARSGLLLSARYCNDEVDNSAPALADSPTQVALKPSPDDEDIQYYLGMALMNPMIIVIIGALQVGVAAIRTAAKKTPFRDNVAWARFPSALTFPAMFVLQPTTTAVVTIYLWGGSSGAMVLAAFSQLAMLGWIFGAAYTAFLIAGRESLYLERPASDSDDDDSANDDDDGNDTKKRPTKHKGSSVWHAVTTVANKVVKMLFEGPGKWADTRRCPGVTAMYRGMYCDYLGHRRWFILFEIATSVFLGICGAALPFAPCEGVNIAIFVFFLAYLVAVVVLRPHEAKFDFIVSIVLTGGQVAAATLNLFAADIASQPVEVIVSTSMIVNVIQGLMRAIGLAFKRLRDVRREARRKRRARMAEMGSRGMLNVSALQSALLEVARRDEAFLTKAEQEAATTFEEATPTPIEPRTVDPFLVVTDQTDSTGSATPRPQNTDIGADRDDTAIDMNNPSHAARPDFELRPGDIRQEGSETLESLLGATASGFRALTDDAAAAFMSGFEQYMNRRDEADPVSDAAAQRTALLASFLSQRHQE